MYTKNPQSKTRRRIVGLGIVLSLIVLSSMPASATSTWTSCVPTEVMAYAARIHVRCAASVGGIRYFALGTSDAANAARILSVLTTAQVAGRTLSILYDPADVSGAQIGCLIADCRLIQAAGFGQ